MKNNMNEIYFLSAALLLVSCGGIYAGDNVDSAAAAAGDAVVQTIKARRASDCTPQQLQAWHKCRHNEVWPLALSLGEVIERRSLPCLIASSEAIGATSLAERQIKRGLQLEAKWLSFFMVNIAPWIEGGVSEADNTLLESSLSKVESGTYARMDELALLIKEKEYAPDLPAAVAAFKAAAKAVKKARKKERKKVGGGGSSFRWFGRGFGGGGGKKGGGGRKAT